MSRFSLVAVLPMVFAVAACAGEAGDGAGVDDEPSAATSNALVEGGDYSACSLTRSSIIASTSVARREAIERGFAWLDANVPYSQSATYEGYRTDCSGFLSMCWETGTSYNTAAFMAGSTPSTQLASFDDLIPGDGFVRSGHAAMFLGWEDAGHTSACIIEMASTASDMQFRSRKTATLKSSGSKPFRLDRLANDLGTPPTGGGGTTTPPKNPPPPTNDTPPEQDQTPDQTPPSSQNDDDESTNEGSLDTPPTPQGGSQGDVGDEAGDEAAAKEKSNKSKRRSGSTTPLTAGGCSMTSSSSTTSNAGLCFVTVAIAISAIRRRRSKSST